MMNESVVHPSGSKLTPLVTSVFTPARASARAGQFGLPRLIKPACFVLAAGLVLAACGRKESKAPPPTSDANPVNPADPPAAQEKARVAQAVAIRSGVVPPPPAIQLRGGEPATPEVLAAYNAQLLQLIVKRRDAPEDLDELVRRWPMPALPTPPRGKQIVYDAKNRIILLYPP